MEVNVLLEGCLEKCSTAEEQGKKDWKKRYFVYKHFVVSSIKCLEYYKDKNWRKQDPKGVLTLYPGYEVVKVYDPKRKFVFDIKTVEHAFRLAASSEDELNKWILLLEKENIVKSYTVEPVPGDGMQKIGARDTCQLHIADTELRLISVHDGYQLVAWPFTCLRRYMSTRGKFTIEAGRRAPTGEGKFSFITTKHDEIYKLLDTVIKSRAGHGAAATLEKSHQKVKRSESTNSNRSITVEEDNRYDHLQSAPGPNPPHPTHPNYDNNILPSHKLGTLKNEDYAAPYGHMKPRESLTSFGVSRDSRTPGFDTESANSSEFDYDTLDYQLTPEKHDHKDDGYNILNPSVPSRKPPPAPRDFTNDLNESREAEDFYNVIGEVPQQPVPNNYLSGASGEGDYNVLEHRTNSPAHGKANPQNQPYDNKASPLKQEVSDTYDSLDYSRTLPPQGPVPKRALDVGFGRVRRSSVEEDGDGYNKLSLVGSPVRGAASKGKPTGDTHGNQYDLESYSTFDRGDTRSAHPPLRKTNSTPSLVPRKCPLEVSSHSVPPTRNDRNSITSISSTGSGFCPLDTSGSFTDSTCSLSPPQSDRDSYASVDYASMSVSRAPPLPVERPTRDSRADSTCESPTQPKPVPYKSRKGSAPDALSIQQSGDVVRSPRKPNKGGNLVSNLRASLEADGLELMKPTAARRRHPRKVSTEDTIPETETYAEIDDGSQRRRASVEDVFQGSRACRSPSAPLEPTEDIYDEPQQVPTQANSSRPKSLQLPKPRLLRKT